MVLQGLVVRRGEDGKLVLPESELEVAAPGDVDGVADRLRTLRKRRLHLLGGLDEELVGLEAPAVGVIERLAGLDAEQHLVRRGILGLQVVAIVRCHQRQGQLTGQGDELAVAALLLRQVVVLDLHVVAIAEDLAVLAHHLPGAIERAVLDRLVDLAGQTAGQGDETAVELAQQIAVDARLVVEALGVAEGDQAAEIAVALAVRRQQDEVIVAARLGVVLASRTLVVAAARRHVDLAAENGLHARGHGGAVELDRAEHVAVVGHRHGGHPRRLHPRDQPLDLVGPIEQRILRVQM